MILEFRPTPTIAHRVSAYSAPILTCAHRHHTFLLKVSWKLGL